VVIAFIPARSGSKGVPNKNSLVLGTETLTGRAISLGLSSAKIDFVVVSTDTDLLVHNNPILASVGAEFATLGEGSVKEVSSRILLHKRRSVDATDTARTSDAVMNFLEGFLHTEDDLILLIQPTSPFREKEELEEFMKGYLDSGYESGLSMKLLESPHPLKSFALQGDVLVLDTTQMVAWGKPRQELPARYGPDGAFYISTIRNLKNNQSFLSTINYVYVREGLRTANIDTQIDFEFAKFIYEHKSDERSKE
jgi:CMP-N,N'-diacetyllegionaminic acid synthase